MIITRIIVSSCSLTDAHDGLLPYMIVESYLKSQPQERDHPFRRYLTQFIFLSTSKAGSFGPDVKDAQHTEIIKSIHKRHKSCVCEEKVFLLPASHTAPQIIIILPPSLPIFTTPLIFSCLCPHQITNTDAHYRHDD